MSTNKGATTHPFGCPCGVGPKPSIHLATAVKTHPPISFENPPKHDPRGSKHCTTIGQRLHCMAKKNPHFTKNGHCTPVEQWRTSGIWLHLLIAGVFFGRWLSFLFRLFSPFSLHTKLKLTVEFLNLPCGLPVRFSWFPHCGGMPKSKNTHSATIYQNWLSNAKSHLVK